MKKYNFTAVAAAVLVAVYTLPTFAQDQRDDESATTWWGAPIAGNEEGTIPAYTGGMTDGPPLIELNEGYVAYPNPFQDEKPRLVITADNYVEYQDKLPAGAIRLFERNPEYKINIYPTHRTAVLPESIREATEANKTACKTADGGEQLAPGCKPGLPFPAPQNGYEIMWNMLVPYTLPIWHTTQIWNVDSQGNPALSSNVETYYDKAHYHQGYKDKTITQVSIGAVTAPPRKAGSVNQYYDFTTDRDRVSYSYDAGTRRVRRSPNFAYDTPTAASNGAHFYDDVRAFSGKMDRFEFELVGEQELFMPYNSYDMYYRSAEDLLMPRYINPEFERWELRRVWKVVGTLKDGQRHGYSKRVLYIDQDTGQVAVADNFDQGGNLFRTIVTYGYQGYKHDMPILTAFTVYDFSKNQYTALVTGKTGFKVVEPLTEQELTPQALQRRGI